MSGQLIDTALNLSVFAYVGFLAWLILRRSK
ncbi:hypothetical protein RUA4292_02720 [Ruegeria atlantica]|uniref:Uncharacterized protein n=1 Tax=Ruegeria atlantica TaxID=81569 RepID=A0A0P1EG03_9RHOB|nr:hypothetical protein RUA4292_02720 [Ruegeria atlantica]